MIWLQVAAGTLLILGLVYFYSTSEQPTFIKKTLLLVMMLSALCGISFTLGTLGSLLDIVFDGRTDIHKLRSYLIAIPICAVVFFGIKRFSNIR